MKKTWNKRFVVEKEAGFTLIEMLVSMAMVGLILAGAYTTQIKTEQSFSSQQQVAEMQQNLRVASNILVSDLQMAGYKVPDNKGFGMGNGDVDIDDDNIPDVPMDGADGAPDTIEVLRGGDLPVTILSYNAPAATAFTTPASNLQVGQVCLVMSPDGSSYMTFEVTHINEGIKGGTMDHINFSPGGSAMNSPNGLGADYTGGQLITFDNTVYFIRTVNGIPELVRGVNGNIQVIARNIEDLQCSYGLDTDGDNFVNQWVDNPSLNRDQIRSIKLSLLGRTAGTDRYLGASGTGGTMTGLENGADHAADGRRRRVLSTRVFVRNMQMN